jgi:peroxin-1
LFLAVYSSSARAIAPNTRGVVILATAQSQAALHPLIGTAHIYSEAINVQPPNKDARKEVWAPHSPEVALY